MTSPQPGTVADDTIDVVLPARTEFASIVRLLASSIGADVGFSVDDIEDLRLALNEVFTSAADDSTTDASSARIAVSMRPGDRRIEVNMTTIPPRAIELDALASSILAAVVDEVVADDGGIAFTKSVDDVGA